MLVCHSFSLFRSRLLFSLKIGGGPVEIGSGAAGLAYSWVLGRRQEKEVPNFKPHNVSMIVLGSKSFRSHIHHSAGGDTFLSAGLLWFGWLGFNGGSAFGANLRAIMAVWNSMLAAAFGGMTWCLLDSRTSGRWSTVGLCSGTIAALIAATPSSGYVQPWSSVIIGILSGSICNFATKRKKIGFSSSKLLMHLRL